MNGQLIKYMVENKEIQEDVLKPLYSSLLKELDAVKQFKSKESYNIKNSYERGDLSSISKISENSSLIETEIKNINEVLFTLENCLFKKYTIYLDVIDDNTCPHCNKQLHLTATHYVIFENRSKDKVIDRNYIKTGFCDKCLIKYIPNKEYQKVLTRHDIEITNIKINKNHCIPPLDIYSVIVLSNTMKCTYDKHYTKDLIAKIPTLNDEGELFYSEIGASYCANCNKFTILKDDLNSIKGVIMCKVIDETTVSSNNNYDEIEIEQRKSILYNYGYNVQTKRNLSNKQRQIILSSVIEAQIMNKRDIINHINGLISRGSKIPSWKMATQKWKEDKEFISKYNPGNLPEVIFNSIILKYNESKNSKIQGVPR